MPRDSFSLQTKVGRFLVPVKGPYEGARPSAGSAASTIASPSITLRQDSSASSRTRCSVLAWAGSTRWSSTRQPGDRRYWAYHSARAPHPAAQERLRRIAAAPQLKREWKQLYGDARLGLHTGEGGAQPEPNERGIDFLLVANMHSLVCFEALDSGILTKCGLIAIDDQTRASSPSAV